MSVPTFLARHAGAVIWGTGIVGFVAGPEVAHALTPRAKRVAYKTGRIVGTAQEITHRRMRPKSTVVTPKQKKSPRPKAKSVDARGSRAAKGVRAAAGAFRYQARQAKSTATNVGTFNMKHPRLPKGVPGGGHFRFKNGGVPRSRALVVYSGGR